MRLHCFQHVAFEGPGEIKRWAADCGHSFSVTRCDWRERLPVQEAFDALVVMGGPMGVSDEAAYPWLVDEKKFLAETVSAGKPVLGICLGAQLLAETLGASVAPGPNREIGFYPVARSPDSRSWNFMQVLPESFMAFHWHGDRFEIPGQAVLLASTPACDHQAFVWKNQVLGLQFHLESDPDSVEELLVHGDPDRVPGGAWVQSAAAMRAGIQLYSGILREYCRNLLDAFFGNRHCSIV